MNLEPYLISYLKANLIWIVYISVKVKILAFSRKHRKMLLQPLSKQRFLKENMKRKFFNGKLFFIKSKNCLSKDPIQGERNVGVTVWWL